MRIRTIHPAARAPPHLAFVLLPVFEIDMQLVVRLEASLFLAEFIVRTVRKNRQSSIFLKLRGAYLRIVNDRTFSKKAYGKRGLASLPFELKLIGGCHQSQESSKALRIVNG